MPSILLEDDVVEVGAVGEAGAAEDDGEGVLDAAQVFAFEGEGELFPLGGELDGAEVGLAGVGVEPGEASAHTEGELFPALVAAGPELEGGGSVEIVSAGAVVLPVASGVLKLQAGPVAAGGVSELEAGFAGVWVLGAVRVDGEKAFLGHHSGGGPEGFGVAFEVDGGGELGVGGLMVGCLGAGELAFEFFCGCVGLLGGGGCVEGECLQFFGSNSVGVLFPKVFEGEVGGARADEVNAIESSVADGADAEPFFVHVLFGGGVVSVFGVVPAAGGVVVVEAVFLTVLPPLVGPLKVKSTQAVAATAVHQGVAVEVDPVVVHHERLRGLFFFLFHGVVGVASGFHEDDGLVEGGFDLGEEVGEGFAAIGVDAEEVDVGTEFGDEVEVLQVAIDDADGVVGVEGFDLESDFVE